MKKLFLLAVVLLVVSVKSGAQDVGQMWVGGSASFSSSKVKDRTESQTSYSIIPEFGYVINEKIGIGINGGYSRSEYTNVFISSYTLPPLNGMGYINEVNYENYTTKTYSIAPFVRYSFMKGDIGGLFVDGSVGYKYSSFDRKSDNNNQDMHTFEIGITPGVAFNVSGKVSLIGKFGFLGYKNNKTNFSFYKDEKIEIKSNEFGFDLNMSSIRLGAIFKF